MHRETHPMKSGKNMQIILKRTALSLHDNLSRFGGLNFDSRAVRNNINVYAATPVSAAQIEASG
jgi:hypothetical protein